MHRPLALLVLASMPLACSGADAPAPLEHIATSSAAYLGDPQCPQAVTASFSPFSQGGGNGMTGNPPSSSSGPCSDQFVAGVAGLAGHELDWSITPGYAITNGSSCAAAHVEGAVYLPTGPGGAYTLQSQTTLHGVWYPATSNTAAQCLVEPDAGSATLPHVLPGDQVSNAILAGRAWVSFFGQAFVEPVTLGIKPTAPFDAGMGAAGCPFDPTGGTDVSVGGPQTMSANESSYSDCPNQTVFQIAGLQNKTFYWVAGPTTAPSSVWCGNTHVQLAIYTPVGAGWTLYKRTDLHGVWSPPFGFFPGSCVYLPDAGSEPLTEVVGAPFSKAIMAARVTESSFFGTWDESATLGVSLVSAAR